MGSVSMSMVSGRHRLNTIAETLDTGKDRVGGLGADEEPGRGVGDIQVLAEGLFELHRRALGGAADAALGQCCKAALDLADPRCRGVGVKCT